MHYKTRKNKFVYRKQLLILYTLSKTKAIRKQQRQKSFATKSSLSVDGLILSHLDMFLRDSTL